MKQEIATDCSERTCDRHRGNGVFRYYQTTYARVTPTPTFKT
jgi:hypothetical protein